MSKAFQQAKAEGAEAARQRRGKACCPYRGGFLREWWLLGYDAEDASEHAKRRRHGGAA